MTSPDPRVLLLGTGGGITPKDGRQSAASAFRCEHSTYVVDCGNGVGPQLIRVSQLILSPLVPSLGVGDEEWTAAARKYFSEGIVVGRDLLEVPV
jgi:ribonuclease BN (tRNA processing enzyme)